MVKSKRQLILGIDKTEIIKAEEKLSIKFPETLKQAWETYNVIELKGGWFVFPIFDQRSPRKTCGNIVYENTSASWRELVPENLLMIAENGTGNFLVVKITDGIASEEVFHWHHETGKLTKWKPTIESILKTAIKSKKSVESLHKQFT